MRRSISQGSGWGWGCCSACNQCFMIIFIRMEPQLRRLHQPTPSLLCPLNIYLIPQGSSAPLEEAFKGRRHLCAVHSAAAAASHAPFLLVVPKLGLPGFRKSRQAKQWLLRPAPLVGWSTCCARTHTGPGWITCGVVRAGRTSRSVRRDEL